MRGSVDGSLGRLGIPGILKAAPGPCGRLLGTSWDWKLLGTFRDALGGAAGRNTRTCTPPRDKTHALLQSDRLQGFRAVSPAATWKEAFSRGGTDVGLSTCRSENISRFIFVCLMPLLFLNDTGARPQTSLFEQCQRWLRCQRCQRQRCQAKQARQLKLSKQSKQRKQSIAKQSLASKAKHIESTGRPQGGHREATTGRPQGDHREPTGRPQGAH